MSFFDKVKDVLSQAERVIPGRRADKGDEASGPRPRTGQQDTDPGRGDGGRDGTTDPGGSATSSTPTTSTSSPTATTSTTSGGPGAQDPSGSADPSASADPTAPSATPGPSAARRYRTHTLQPGQTLGDVAAAHGVDEQELATLNGVDPELVFAGQVLRIPHG